MSIESLYEIYKQYPSVQTDTRKLKNGDLFFALKGDNFNGNSFARKAIDAGAVYSVIDEPGFEIPGKTVMVENVLTTLQQLAKYHREQFSIPFIAITGSNGKTTTKELIHAVLSSSFKTYTTEGNLNNHIGIPLTILKIKPDAEVAVIEMGANHQKEIEGYCKYTLPTHGLITNAGKAHLEGFGGPEGVKKGKGELFDYLRTNNGTAFVMNDYDYLREMSKGIPTVITYGTHEAQTIGSVKKSEPFLEVAIKDFYADSIKTNLVGDYNLPNVLAAVCIGRYFKIEDHRIKTSIERYTPSNSRSQLIEKDSNKIILDAYNANPSSMKVAIENFALMNGDKKVLVLGGMMELGADSIAEHQKLVELIQQSKWQDIVLVGKDFKDLPGNFIHFNNVNEARDWYRKQQFNNTQVLIKGSRSMQMEKLLE